MIHHSLPDLEGNNLFFHELHPPLALPWSHPILPQFEEHSALLSPLRFPDVAGKSCTPSTQVNIRKAVEAQARIPLRRENVPSDQEPGDRLSLVDQSGCARGINGLGYQRSVYWDPSP